VSGSGVRPLLELLLPGGCVVCRRWIPTGAAEGARPELVCGRCRSRLAVASWPRCPRCHHPRGTGREDAEDCLECREWPEELTAARYAHVLVAPASDLVHALKYEGWRELAIPMAIAMARVAPRLAASPDVASARAMVVPVPTTARRLRERGYNQAGLLASGVAGALGLPVLEALTRARASRSQTTLAPGERRENVRGAFAPAPSGARGVAGAHVLLVDDVLTTGATAGEAARTLAHEGAVRVTLLTFARALPRLAARAA
jgi:ComF family protein